MFGGGGAATLEAFPTPLGSTNTLVAVPIAAPVARAPAVPAAAEPECPAAAGPPPPRADEAAGVATTRNNAIANFVVAFDMGSSFTGTAPNVKPMLGR
jgi:hypothetical protein